MGVKQEVVNRIQEICADRNIKLNELANLAGITPSTVYSLMDSSHKDISIITIKKICDGLNISLGAFFSTETFEKLDQEVK